VFYLDNVDLGGLNKKHDSIPHIADFSYAFMKRMIIMVTSGGKGETAYAAAMVTTSTRNTLFFPPTGRINAGT
jgi:hypothetical protein